MEDLKKLKNELQNIIIRNEPKGKKNLIKTAQTNLSKSSQAGSKAKAKFSSRTKEERALADFAGSNKLWVDENSLSYFLTEGAEQKIYFQSGSNYVTKIADAVFYKSWFDYFNNLLLLNYFFPSTRYELTGFLNKKEKIFAVVKQHYIISTNNTNLSVVKDFLIENGFQHKKNNDYYHPYLGIILEDLHDENVLTSNGILFFIDTVIYLTEEFYK